MLDIIIILMLISYLTYMINGSLMMKLSSKARYGTRAMLELALKYPEGSVSVKEMAGSQDISVKYLEQIMSSLKSAGLVRSERGVRGGYWLARAPEDINLKDVVHALEGSSALVDCLHEPARCPRGENCPTREVWNELQSAMEGVLESRTLKDLVNMKKSDNDKSQNYTI